MIMNLKSAICNDKSRNTIEWLDNALTAGSKQRFSIQKSFKSEESVLHDREGNYNAYH